MADDDQFDFLYKIVMIGDSGVGKTNLLSRFASNTFSFDTKSTVGVEFVTKTIVIDGKTIKYQIWDTAGQEKFRAITNAYYQDAQATIAVFDLTKGETFENISIWLSQIREYAESDINIMLLGNKSDLKNRDIKNEDIEKFIINHKLCYMETSAFSGENVENAFNNIIREIYERVQNIPDEKKQQKNYWAPQPAKKSKKHGRSLQKSKKDNGKIILAQKKQYSQTKKKNNCC